MAFSVLSALLKLTEAENMETINKPPRPGEVEPRKQQNTAL